MFYLVLCRQKVSVLVLCLYSIPIVSLVCLCWLGVGGVGGVGGEVGTLSRAVLCSAFLGVSKNVLVGLTI